MSLPEKKYYSIDEIVKRWNCEENLLFHYFEMGILHPAILFKAMICELWEGNDPGNADSSELKSKSFVPYKPIYFWSYNDLVSLYINYQQEIHLNGHIFVFNYQNPSHWLRVQKEKTPTYVITNNDFIITKEERDRFENEYDISVNENKAKNLPEFDYVDITRIEELRSLQNNGEFDLTKLYKLIDELNYNWKTANYFSTVMLVRTIIDHIPPIFGYKSFSEVCNNYKGNKSFKDASKNLELSLRKIADNHLHSQIAHKESLPNRTQVNFSNTLDLLLAEIINILEKPKT